MDLMQLVTEALKEHNLDFEQWIDEGDEVVLKDIQSLSEYYSTLALLAMKLNGQNGVSYKISREENTTYITATR